jgi:hypothetical protein
MPGVRPAPWLIAAALALAWFALAPPTPDLAAQVYRAELFRSDGFTLFNANWYGGHHTPAYSILFPPLGALLGVRVVGVLAAVASAVFFERIARRHFGDNARWGALWFGAGTVADLLIGRLTFAVGVAFALAAVYVLQRGHRRSGLALGVCCTLASPVAGLFLALAGVAHAVAVRERLGLWLAGAAMIPAFTLTVLFPEGGSQPYSAETLLSIVLCCALLLWLLPVRERALRTAALLYLGAGLLAFAIATPMGGNASRLGVAFAGPLLLCAARSSWPQRRLVLAALVPLFVWQWWAPVRETLKGAVDPSGQASYFAPMLRFIDQRAEAAVRVEVPFTRLHWESVYVARDVPLARGWVTQLDVKYNPLFRSDAAARLSPERYRRWLDREGVRYVALPDVALDPTGRAEGALIRRGLPYLRAVYRNRHWAIYEVLGTPGLADGVGRLTKIAPQSFDVRVRRPGFTLVRVRFTPYWRIARGRGCVMRSTAGWTLVYALSTGPMRVEAAFDPRRLIARNARCTGVPETSGAQV